MKDIHAEFIELSSVIVAFTVIVCPGYLFEGEDNWAVTSGGSVSLILLMLNEDVDVSVVVM